jgi:hypothetical protein
MHVIVIRKQSSINTLTCNLLGFSIFFIQLFACPWGSIINVHLWEFVTIIPLSTEKLETIRLIINEKIRNISKGFGDRARRPIKCILYMHACMIIFTILKKL